MPEFETWTVRREWQLVLQKVDQYGHVVQDLEILEREPTHALAVEHLPKHGIQNPWNCAWRPVNPPHDFVELRVLCRDVRIG